MEEKRDKELEQFYFFDSYAAIEIIKKNSSYLQYAEVPIVITIFNLAEIYYYSIRGLSSQKADEIYQKYREAVVEVDDETLKAAMQFRKQLKKQDISYTDCIGYIYAKQHNLKFLTGDKEFEGMENVEFVK